MDSVELSVEARVTRMPAFARTPDRFEEWLRTPVTLPPADPRLEVRRALPSEFEAIYDLVDEVFGTKRPRACYDWLYRKNPGGLARCWVVIERQSGVLLGTGAEWPWPLARGEEPLEGTQSGDAVVRRAWQRRGIDELRRQSKWSHPRFKKSVTLLWPSEKLFASDKKYGRDGRFMGPVPRQLLPLDSRRLLREGGWPRPLATAAGLVADAAFASWWSLRFGVRTGAKIEEIRSFDSAFDTVTKKCTFTESFWCPHDSEFLNWRYLSHPTADYQAFAALADEEVAGYCVVGIDGERASLMEFVAPSSRVAVSLLHHAIGIARNAGCNRLEFFSTRPTPHRRLFYSSGFLKRSSRLFLVAEGLDEPAVHRLDNWQCFPGDTDFL